MPHKKQREINLYKTSWKKKSIYSSHRHEKKKSSKYPKKWKTWTRSEVNPFSEAFIQLDVQLQIWLWIMHQKKLEELKGTLSLAVIDMMWYEFPYFRYDFFVLKEFHGQPYVDAKFPH